MKKVIVFIVLAVVLFFALKPLYVTLSNHAIGIPVAKYANKGFPLSYYSLKEDRFPWEDATATAKVVDLNIPGWAITFDNIFDWVIAFLISGGIILIYSKIKKRKTNTSTSEVFNK